MVGWIIEVVVAIVLTVEGRRRRELRTLVRKRRRNVCRTRREVFGLVMIDPEFQMTVEGRGQRTSFLCFEDSDERTHEMNGVTM